MITINERKWSVYDLLNGCPMGSPLSTCPLLDKRKSNQIDNYKLAVQTPEEDIASLIEIHNYCLKIREEELAK